MAAGRSGSSIIKDAGLAISLGWLSSIYVYMGFISDEKTPFFILIDFFLAVYFFRLSRGSLFPVPLFLIHVVQVTYHLLLLVLGISSWYLLTIVMNRLFELSVLYVFVCARYRRRALQSRYA